MTAPMEGLRVLEVAEHTFVPAAAAVLSDWGADVVKIEHVTRGDAMRGLGRTGSMDLGSDDVHPLLEHSNRGKRSLGLDLATAAGREILYRLAEQSDVFLTNKLPRVLTALQIDVDDIRARNPRIVYVKGSGFGPRGPDRDAGGYDVLGYWCRSGLAAAARPAGFDGMVHQPSPAYGDSIGAMTIAGGISAALLHRERTGEAPVVDVSLLATGMWAMGAGIALSQHLDRPWLQDVTVQGAARNPLAHAYRTADDRWIYLSCLQGAVYWPGICEVIGRPELAADPRFATHDALGDHAQEAIALLDEEFAAHTLAEWKALLAGFDGQWAAVQDSLEVVHDPQVEANGYIVHATMRTGKEVPLVATPVQFDGAPSPTRRAPDFNEHGDEILTTLLGLGEEELLQLKLDDVVA